MRLLLFLFGSLCSALVGAQESVPALRGSSDAGQRVFDSRVRSAPVPSDTLIREVAEVDVPPAYPGGEQALIKQLGQAPDCSLSNVGKACYSSTRVILSFVVEHDGSISQLQADPAGCHDLNEHARCAAMGLSRFTPGTNDGKPVRVRMRLPIIYELR